MSTSWPARRAAVARGYASLVNRFSATRAGSWLVKHVAAKVDPKLFRATNGRFTLTGVPTLPMLTLTAVGRRSGQSRSIQLAYHERDGDRYVVASAMGQERHPAWSYNIEATPEVEVQARGERYPALATRLSDVEKAEIWPQLTGTIPQIRTYERRTDRDIKVYRLTRR
jgi:deazaflavin-dependent oxidoreductase (nitroreductase family)